MFSLMAQAQCQGLCGENEPGEEGDMAEYDSVLVECAGCVIGPLASVAGGEVFLPFFRSLLPQLLRRLVSSIALFRQSIESFPYPFQSAASTVADKSFAIGTLAEV